MRAMMREQQTSPNQSLEIFANASGGMPNESQRLSRWRCPCRLGHGRQVLHGHQRVIRLLG